MTKTKTTGGLTVHLQYPDLETGERLESITLRRPRARDLKAAIRQAGRSASPLEVDIALFSHLAELPPDHRGARSHRLPGGAGGVRGFSVPRGLNVRAACALIMLVFHQPLDMLMNLDLQDLLDLERDAREVLRAQNAAVRRR